MDRTTAQAAMLVAAVLLVAVTQATLWFRYGRAHPHTTWPAVLGQGSALAVVALLLAQAGQSAMAAGVTCVAATTLAGVTGSLVGASRAARQRGTTWRAEHREGLKTMLLSVEAAAAVVAVLLVATWLAGRYNSGFDPAADTNLCRLLKGC